MLSRRSSTGDAARAAALLDDAVATFEKLGMRGCLERARTLREGWGRADHADTPPPLATAAGASPPLVAEENIFRREGDFWTIGYGGERYLLKHAKGLQHIAELLRRHGQELFCTDLVNALGEAAPPTREPVDSDVVVQIAVSGLGTPLDPRARAEFRQRLVDLRQELAEARRFNDVGRIEVTEREITFLLDELRRAARRSSGAAERARINVRNSISTALKSIQRNAPQLWRHLSNAIKTGTVCSYTPENPVRWVL